VRVRTVRLGFDSGTTYTLWPLGDVHYGSANCDTALFDETIRAIKNDPQALWVGMGDMVECIAPNDKRWNAGGVDEKVVNLASQDRIGDVYVEKLAEKLKPIADKCIGYGDGNHEAAFDSHYYTNLSVRVLERIGQPDAYNGWACLTRLAFQDGSNHRTALRIFTQHGWQGGRMDGAKVNESRRLMAYIDADIYLTGHSHSKFIVPNTRLTVNPSWTREVAQTVYVAHTGSFLRTLQQDRVGYAERAGYPPTTLGTVRFTITPTPYGEVHIEGIL
jgi:predicted phosphodiesterase